MSLVSRRNGNNAVTIRPRGEALSIFADLSAVASRRSVALREDWLAKVDSPYRILLIAAASRFERAVPCRSVPDERSEFHLASDDVWRFKFSFEHQRSRVAADIAEREFNVAREDHRISVAWGPLCRPGAWHSPNFRFLINQLPGAFPLALRL